MKYYGFTINNVRTHKYWSGKHCPAWLLDGKYSMTWEWFKSGLVEPKTFKVKIICSELNIRKGPGTSYKVLDTITDKGVYTIVKQRGNWGCLKKGPVAGSSWIHLGYTKKV